LCRKIIDILCGTLDKGSFTVLGEFRVSPWSTDGRQWSGKGGAAQCGEDEVLRVLGVVDKHGQRVERDGKLVSALEVFHNSRVYRMGIQRC
jgi:hypothetical protein